MQQQQQQQNSVNLESFLYTIKISFNNEEKFKISSDEGKLRKCVAKEHSKETYE